MEPLVLKFTDNKEEFSFENKVYVIDNKKLARNIEKINFKNSDSVVVIKSLNDLHVSDVTQIKVNLSNTGTFLVSFKREDLTEEKRQDLLKRIALLKSEEEPTFKTQISKAKKLMRLLGFYHPIYATFSANGSVKIVLNDFWIKYLEFPLLVLPKHNKFLVHVGAKRNKSDKNEPLEKSGNKKQSKPFELFLADYFFIALFALLGSLAIVTSIFEIMNKNAIGYFLIALAAAFIVTETIAMSLTIYEKGKEKNPFLRFYLIIYILVGIIVGLVGGYFLSKGLIKTEDPKFDYKKLLMLSALISSLGLLSSIVTSIPTNKVITLIKSKKKKEVQ